MASGKTIKVTCTAANTAYNVQTGTITGPTARNKDYVGVEANFQNQTDNSVASIGFSDVVSNAGIILIDKGTNETVRGVNPSAVNLADWWVSSDTAGGIVVVQLRRFV
jgi:hypothetical protein